MRREVIEQLQAMLARGSVPLVPQQGSVGASGDLAPLAHMTAAMIGDGQAIVDGKTMPAREALAAAGLAPLTLGPKEGLALINGTQFSTAYALAGVFARLAPGAARRWSPARCRSMPRWPRRRRSDPRSRRCAAIAGQIDAAAR